jgi:hypothetical protein
LGSECQIRSTKADPAGFELSLKLHRWAIASKAIGSNPTGPALVLLPPQIASLPAGKRGASVEIVQQLSGQACVGIAPDILAA